MGMDALAAEIPRAIGQRRAMRSHVNMNSNGGLADPEKIIAFRIAENLL
jgi:hypothetical protein